MIWKMKGIRNSDGFSLIEMIGVLGVIALLAAALAPKVFQSITDAKHMQFVKDVSAIETGVVAYYKDKGTLENAAGTDGDLGADLIGTYITSVPVPTVATAMTLSTITTDGTACSAGAVAIGNSFDLSGAGTPCVVGQLVYLTLTDVSLSDFTAIDALMEPDLGAAVSDGRLKWDATDGMAVYIAHN